ncbi:MAG: ATPase domain-containing protein [Candidatus Micrarchaeia archaeon]
MANENGRAPTGIEGLDEMIEGGFERESIIMVAADAGAGKSTLALQFLHNGAAVYGESGLYITFEEPKLQVYQHMKRFGWDFEMLEKKGKFRFMQYAPHEAEKFFKDGTVIEDTIKDMGIKRVVIDSITSFALLFENDYKMRQAVLQLFANLKKWGVTSLITSEGELNTLGDMKAKFGVEFIADGFIAIHSIRKKEVRDFALEVVKMRGTNHFKKMVPLKMVEGKGVVLYPSQPVFESAAGF